MWWKILLVVLAFVSHSPSSRAEQNIVRVATLEDYAPFCMTEGEFEWNQIIQVGEDATGFQGL